MSFDMAYHNYDHLCSAKGLQRMYLLQSQMDREQERITILLISN